jgi:hypothetical protein
MLLPTTTSIAAFIMNYVIQSLEEEECNMLWPKWMHFGELGAWNLGWWEL